MRYLVLACDYDETLARCGRIAADVTAALDRVAASGRRLLLVTGRELDDLLSILERPERFDWIVAENGAVLYHPPSRQATVAAERVPDAFVEALRQRGVQPLSMGRIIVSTCAPQETVVVEAMRELGLELQITFNKGAVMVLPAGITKATGLTLALQRLRLSPHNVVGIGDGENDHAFLTLCECAAAVANAVPMLKARADIVTDEPNGRGAQRLLEELLEDDLARYAPRLTRHQVIIGTDDQQQPVALDPYGHSVLIAGASGGGKSSLTTAVLERLVERDYQCCILDPEGDYGDFPGALVLGDAEQPPTVAQVLQALDRVETTVVVNLLGLSLNDRPGFFSELLPQLQHYRVRTGRPHWLTIDEAHHLLPQAWTPVPDTLPAGLQNTLFITVEPAQVSATALASVDIAIGVGPEAYDTLVSFARVRGVTPPSSVDVDVPKRHALWWEPGRDRPPRRFAAVPTRSSRRRHRRKYAAGDVGDDRSFVFRGPEGALKLRARNLIAFMEMADGVDDRTWLHHLRQGDYSQWFRETIKDKRLAAEAETIERSGESAEVTRAGIREAIERRYTLPEAAPPETSPTSMAAAAAHAAKPHESGDAR